MHLNVQTSPGEFLDRLTILEIKAERIADPAKLANVNRELARLRAAWTASAFAGGDAPRLVAELKAVNESLWDIEDRIRRHEAEQRFDAEFVELARTVYHTNDRRAAIKRQLNLQLGSDLLEEKSYRPY
jgi:hypothetical protein